MKKTSFFGKALLGAAVVTMSMSTIACKDENKQEDSKEVAEEENEAKYDDVNDDKEEDSDYLIFAAEVDMKEIELGKLAQQKSTNPDVQALGKMMVDQHTKSLADLKAAATKKNISIPETLTDKAENAISKGNNLSFKYPNITLF